MITIIVQSCRLTAEADGVPPEAENEPSALLLQLRNEHLLPAFIRIPEQLMPDVVARIAVFLFQYFTLKNNFIRLIPLLACVFCLPSRRHGISLLYCGT